MTLLQLQDKLPTVIRTLLKQTLYQIKYNFEPGKFYSIIGESEQENPLSCPCLLV